MKAIAYLNGAVLSYKWWNGCTATWNKSNYELAERATVYCICQPSRGNLISVFCYLPLSFSFSCWLAAFIHLNIWASRGYHQLDCWSVIVNKNVQHITLFLILFSVRWRRPNLVALLFSSVQCIQFPFFPLHKKGK